MQLEATAPAFIKVTLLESLELNRDFPVSQEQEWLAEIRHRCAEIDIGKTRLIESSAVINDC
jgi:hypothetical protein